jgi:branched-chain amino acid transport system permease protein
MTATGPTPAAVATTEAGDRRPEARLPEARLDKIPLLLVPVLALLALPLTGSASTWVTLTVAGLAMGMMIFMMASGLTLVFGLMDVMNFAHAAFISVGAYVAASVLLRFSGWMQEDNFLLNMAAVIPAVLAAMLVTGILGWFFERVIIMPVYGQHLKQILITMGGLIVAEQLIVVIWGPDMIPLAKPETLRGSYLLGEVAIEKYRVLAVVAGLLVFGAMFVVLNRTRIGLLIRAGVEDGEMVESLGYRIRRLFIAVFVAGAALAGLGGAMWGMYQESVSVAIGGQMMVLIFIVIIIGGLGSVGGCFVGALLVGLLANYVGYLAPKIALGSNILLMVAILLWRPQGLYPVAKK